ncbi:hypothetical protein PHYBLDRAFT_141317 [Phycomyces blakesleeanus NRRL 1555(-)]|uniref:Wax synthase domain-containing protein n=2 Tax=Phycomyces blakesleeanus TaxID=4837 RepID=A0A167P7Y6_PHYB8|nr:hypothetical protein PHYBLDRAFT_141317 [Phycomyces blakesleeanus NRRL 1555(-)]OAD77429.1 hypothetical protein PHYBLDRAFT_141317 [Phycomyces blakesleeanus NRRL 1555(-)]|eukprot:XP_018295469.1 hypothetical protein PHYBLDRAFT_141317 [Phycomyces blakesleeanus NRRL 1555(-)]
MTLATAHFTIPLLHDGNGDKLGMSAVGLIASCLSARMVFYTIDLNRLPVGGRIPPLWDVITPEPSEKPEKIVTVPIQKVRSDALCWLLMANLSLFMLMPVMVPFDTFLRVCAVPPETFSSKSYGYVLLDFITLRGKLPLRSLYYHMVMGFTVHLHVAILLPLYRIFRSAQLLAYSFLPVKNKTELVQPYYTAYIWLVDQPPIFNKPWLSRSAYELWSKRWHQKFRPGFLRIGYFPIKRLFGKQTKAGHIAAVMGAFVVSGLMHDYVLLTIRGYSQFNQVGVKGYQTIFFVLQAIASIVSSPDFPLGPKQLPLWVGRLLTVSWIAVTGPLFMEPYVRISFQTTMEVPVFPYIDSAYAAPFCPYGLAN